MRDAQVMAPSWAYDEERIQAGPHVCGPSVSTTSRNRIEAIIDLLFFSTFVNFVHLERYILVGPTSVPSQ